MFVKTAILADINMESMSGEGLQEIMASLISSLLFEPAKPNKRNEAPFG